MYVDEKPKWINNLDATVFLWFQSKDANKNRFYEMSVGKHPSYKVGEVGYSVRQSTNYEAIIDRALDKYKPALEAIKDIMRPRVSLLCADCLDEECDGTECDIPAGYVRSMVFGVKSKPKPYVDEQPSNA
jgi:hypothetical protein